MNKGKETYQNIPLPNGLSAAIENGLKRGRRYQEKKWAAAFGSLAAACVLGVVLYRAVSGTETRMPLENDPSGTRISSGPENRASDGQTPAEAQAFPVSGNEIPDSQITAEPLPSEEESPSSPSGAQDAAAAAPENETASSLKVYGTAQIQDGQILLESDGEGAPYPGILLNITEDTVILSASDYSQKTLDDIQEGEQLYAYVSPVMTRSLPPMSNAFLILCDVSEDMAVPTYAQIMEISADEDGVIRIVTDQQLILIPGEDTSILTLDGDTQLSVSDLSVGDRILASYQFMTMSIPAQTNPEEIRLMP